MLVSTKGITIPEVLTDLIKEIKYRSHKRENISTKGNTIPIVPTDLIREIKYRSHKRDKIYQLREILSL